jgi:exodeoxyribonuclease-5
LGDPAQLPPVRGEGFFTNAEPDIMLTEVHRQAKDSPIIRLATIIREGGRIEYGDYGDCRVVSREEISSADVLDADTVLVGRNVTRTGYNRRIRQLKGIDAELPIGGEKLICLRNSRLKKTLNGSIWTVAETKKRSKRDRSTSAVRMSIRAEEWPADSKTIEVTVREEFFRGDEANLEWEQKKGTDEFTFGYALTVHKSQGSQWDRVLLFDEGSAFREEAWRWRYTGITRAAQQITVVQ